MSKSHQTVLKSQSVTSTAAKVWTVQYVFDAATEQLLRTWFDPAAPTVAVRADWVGPLAPTNEVPTGSVRGKAPDVS